MNKSSEGQCSSLSEPSKISARTKVIASIAIFSALYTVLRMIQIVPMIGVPAGRFSLSDILAPLCGIILGPYVGGFSVILGTFIAMALGRPVLFLGLDFLPALVNTVAIGLLFKRKWWPIVVLNVALLLAFLLNPWTTLFISIGGISFPFAWLHIVAFVVLLSPLGLKAVQWVESLKPTRLTAGMAILAFVGTMMQHLMGNILYDFIYLPTPVYWAGIFFVYPIERSILIILSVVIGIPLIRVLKKSYFRSEKQTTSA